MAVSPDPIKTIFPALTRNRGFQIRIQLIFWRIQLDSYHMKLVA